MIWFANSWYLEQSKWIARTVAKRTWAEVEMGMWVEQKTQDGCSWQTSLERSTVKRWRGPFALVFQHSVQLAWGAACPSADGQLDWKYVHAVQYWSWGRGAWPRLELSKSGGQYTKELLSCQQWSMVPVTEDSTGRGPLLGWGLQGLGSRRRAGKESYYCRTAVGLQLRKVYIWGALGVSSADAHIVYECV